MKTKEVVQLYFKKLKEKSDWQSLIADDIKFESPSLTAIGKNGYIVAASRFFSDGRNARSKISNDGRTCSLCLGGLRALPKK